jgi:multiple sugar transport system permease protein
MKKLTADRRFVHSLVIPIAIIVVLVGFLPIFYSFNLSLTDFSLIVRSSKYIGFANYIRLLTDPRYIHALVFTLVFALVATGIELLVGFVLAYVLADKSVSSRYSSAMRTLMMVPYIVAPVAVSYTYKSLIYDPNSGYLNYFLKLFHLAPFIIFNGRWNAIIAVLVMEIILRTPFITLILYAGISAVPDSILEAAEIDGAGIMQRIFKVIIPFISPVLVVAFIFRYMDAIKMFDEIYVLTKGGPGIITENVSIYASAQSFEFFHAAYAAASTFIFFIVVMIIINVFLKVGKFGTE